MQKERREIKVVDYWRQNDEKNDSKGTKKMRQKNIKKCNKIKRAGW